ncbi:MAG TPA: HD domain-containing protein [Candidatus Thermoplasmatota archaeon]|nr:HD domain-containing protein [Candidatus Thermoplasmatota archaeon]
MTRVRDPIHDYIPLDAWAKEVIDGPRMQRLRRVHQLGSGSLVYPGAKHTRFEHSLGAYHLAGLAAAALDLPAPERKALQAAALLHDVGHGPFSHTSDPLYRDFLQRTHEDVSAELVARPPIADILTRHGVDPAAVASLIHGEGPLADLVSGGLDVDRMDYVVRDAHYTGVNVGVDLRRLVTDIRLTPRGVALGHGSLPAAEMLLVTRLQMYATVYFHRTLRAGERMLERALRLALEAGEIKPEQLPTMDDIAATMLLRHSKTDAWRLMLGVDQRKLLKVALEEPLSDFREDALADVAQSAARQSALEREIAAAIGLAPHEVIVDVPEPPRHDRQTALVAMEDGRLVDLAEVSSLVRALASAERDHWRLRVMVPASRREQAAGVAGRILARELG